MRPGAPALLTFLLVETLAGVSLRSICADSIFTDKAQENVQRCLKEGFGDRPGAMVIALVDTRTNHVYGAGKTKPGRKPTRHTLFEIGSITKTFTSLSALEMSRRGEWELGDPISKHLLKDVSTPKWEGQAISVFNLAAQDSQLPFNPDNFKDKGWPHTRNDYVVSDLY